MSGDDRSTPSHLPPGVPSFRSPVLPSDSTGAGLPSSALCTTQASANSSRGPRLCPECEYHDAGGRERKRLVYKRSIRGDVKDIFVPRPEGERDSVTSSPCSLCAPLASGFLPSSPAAGLAWFHLDCILIEERRRRSVSEAGKPWRLPGWQHIGLSEARGLVLFRVVRDI